MKLVTLNIWGGLIHAPLMEFIKLYQDVDIFCLQEVYHNAVNRISNDERSVNLKIFSEIQQLLPQHRAFFRPVVNDVFGLGMFVKNDIEILGEGDIFIHENPDYPGFGPTHSRNLQWVTCSIQGAEFSVLNVHCLWNGAGKTDTLDRIAQSHKIRSFMDVIHTPKILCGDFNLRPDTKSIEIINAGMRNLIKDYDIKSTRTSLYPKEERFADYIFTSPCIIVNEFKVLPDEVSDHSALLLDFDIMD